MEFCKLMDCLFFSMSLMGFSFAPDPVTSSVTSPSAMTSDDEDSEEEQDSNERKGDIEVMDMELCDSEDQGKAGETLSATEVDRAYKSGLYSVRNGGIVEIPDIGTVTSTKHESDPEGKNTVSEDVHATPRAVNRKTTAETHRSEGESKMETKGCAKQCQSSKVPVWRKVYCICMCCLLWIRTVSAVPSFWVGIDFDPDLTANKVILCMWLLQCAMNVTITVYGCFSREELPSVIELWKTICRSKTVSQNEETQRDPLKSSPQNIVNGFSGLNGKARKRKSSKTAPLEDTGQPEPRTASVHLTGYEKPSTKENGDRLQSNNTSTEILVSRPTDLEMRTDLIRTQNTRDEAVSVKMNADAKKAENQIHKNEDANNATDAQIKRSVKIYSILAWALVFINSAIMVISVFGKFLPGLSELSSFLTSPFGSSLGVKVVFCVIHVISSCAWVLPTAFCCGFCAMMRAHFNSLAGEISAGLARCKKRFPKELENWRQHHSKLCQCVTALDRTMGKMLMTSYVTNLPLCIFLLYVMVKKDDDLVSLVTHVFWTVSSLGNILLISIQAALVHEAAHSPLENLFDVRADLASSRQLSQLQLFIYRLTGTSIGFTTYGIFTVTKDLLLTLGGILLTYFFVLIQFQI